MIEDQNALALYNQKLKTFLALEISYALALYNKKLKIILALKSHTCLDPWISTIYI